MFPIRNDLKKGDALWSLLFDFALYYVIKGVQLNQDGLKLNGTYQVPVYVNGINILGGSVYTVKEDAEGFLVASKETGLEVNAGKINYMVKSRDQDSALNHYIQIDNSSLKACKSSNILELL
jgi:hypothetical protein